MKRHRASINSKTLLAIRLKTEERKEKRDKQTLIECFLVKTTVTRSNAEIGYFTGWARQEKSISICSSLLPRLVLVIKSFSKSQSPESGDDCRSRNHCTSPIQTKAKSVQRTISVVNLLWLCSTVLLRVQYSTGERERPNDCWNAFSTRMNLLDWIDIR